MDSGILYDYLSNNSLDTGNLMVNYSFEKIQGGVVYNEIYTDADHFPQAGCLNASIWPGILVSCVNHTGFESFKTCCSMAYFDSNTVMRVGHRVEEEDWTIFINYNNNVIRDKEKAEVIFSSMDSPSAVSGFNFGINGSNRAYLEYVSTNGILKTVILPRELELYNLISIAKNKSQISISNHDPFSRKNYTTAYYSNDFVDSSIWTIGGFYKTGIYERYKGFRGWIDDFIVFDSFYGEIERNTISEALYFTGTEEAYEQTGTQIVSTISGAPTIISKASSSAITGYEMRALNDVKTVCDTPITICEKIDLTGSGYIDVLEFPRVNVEEMIIDIVPEQRLYNELYTSKYAEKNVVFLKDIDYKDYYEIHSNSGYDANLNKVGTFEQGFGAFLINDLDVGKDMDIFINGAFQLNGTGYNLASTDFIVYTGVDFEFDKVDNLLYDISKEAAVHYVYGGDEYPSLTLTGQQYLNKDIYFRGQKQISGENENYEEWYAAQYSGVQIGTIDDGYNKGIPGVYSFVARSELFEQQYSGTVDAYDRLNFNLRNEKIWLNGWRQIEDVDYIKTSEQSLLNSDLRLEKKTYLIYNNEGNYFDITV
jgi:hypothetical protein